MPATFTRRKLSAIGIVVAALLGAILFVSAASAQDVPANSPIPNGGIMAGAAGNGFHAGVRMGDTAAVAPHRRPEAHTGYAVHAGAMGGRMQGGMASRHTPSGATGSGYAHMAGRVGNQTGAEIMGPRMRAHGVNSVHANGLPCTDCR